MKRQNKIIIGIIFGIFLISLSSAAIFKQNSAVEIKEPVTFNGAVPCTAGLNRSISTNQTGIYYCNNNVARRMD